MGELEFSQCGDESESGDFGERDIRIFVDRKRPPNIEAIKEFITLVFFFLDSLRRFRV